MGYFKQFLLNESKAFFGQRVGDILSAVQDLETDMDDMGTRQVVKLSQNIVNQIRRILHSSWPDERSKDLKDLQKIAVALMKTIDEKGDVRSVLSSVGRELEKISGKLGVKINNMGPEEEGNPVDQQDFETSPQPEPMPPNQPGIPLNQPEGTPPEMNQSEMPMNPEMSQGQPGTPTQTGF